MMKYINSLLLLTVVFSSSVFSQTGNTQNNQVTADLVNLMKIEFEAYQTHNASQWSPLVDDQAIFVGEDEGFKTKGQILQEIQKAPPIFQTATETYHGIIVRVYDDTAILSCLADFSFKDSSGKMKSMYFRFTRVHKYENGKWKLVFHSAIPM